MRAIGVTQYGAPEMLHELDLPAEPLGPGQVRIHVTAATVNPTDTGLRSGSRATGDRPEGGVAVPGMDVAGTLIDIGEGVTTEMAIDDHVMAIVLPAGAHGGYREDLVLPARSVVRVPDGVSDVEASTLPMNGLTARQALDVLALQPGRVLAVTGAAGAVGGYAIQIAKSEGLTVIADAAEADEHLVRELGADAVVHRGDDVADRFRDRFPDGVDGVVDAALLGEAVLPALREGGAMGTVRGYAGDGSRGLRVIPVSVRAYGEEWDKLDALRQMVEDGAITLRVAETYQANRAADAHRRLEAGGTRGRLVLRFD